jgi:hypothetical protein
MLMAGAAGIPVPAARHISQPAAPVGDSMNSIDFLDQLCMEKSTLPTPAWLADAPALHELPRKECSLPSSSNEEYVQLPIASIFAAATRGGSGKKELVAPIAFDDGFFSDMVATEDRCSLPPPRTNQGAEKAMNAEHTWLLPPTPAEHSPRDSPMPKSVALSKPLLSTPDLSRDRIAGRATPSGSMPLKRRSPPSSMAAPEPLLSDEMSDPYPASCSSSKEDPTQQRTRSRRAFFNIPPHSGDPVTGKMDSSSWMCLDTQVAHVIEFSKAGDDEADADDVVVTDMDFQPRHPSGFKEVRLRRKSLSAETSCINDEELIGMWCCSQEREFPTSVI